jgi:hypothetical protein
MESLQRLQEEESCMRKLQLWILAVSPFVLGYLLDSAMMRFNWYGTTLTVISVLFYVYWYCAGYVSANWTKSITESTLVGNSFAMVSFVLITVQTTIVKRFLTNILGLCPQMFFLPSLRLAAQIESVLLFFLPIRYFWATCFVSLALMVVVYRAGHKAGSKRKRGSSAFH